ncbi:hypothetical protein SAMN04488054_10894 [Salibacterium qingdaonense]|uniref:Uncharacterized protein n=1 Tax=Salibacterium qingdaonense TaxID=266892 RepID=A0A1I4LQ33_9BACI|nr:hypothetical protein SAMN04488054_10894 [Salibacterium qingdaonense]
MYPLCSERGTSPPPSFLRPWKLLLKNKGLVSKDHHFVDTTPLKSGISGCRWKSMDTICRQGTPSIPGHYLRGYYVCCLAI